MARYTYLWEFRIEPASRAEFERHYGPNGVWIELFRQSSGYIETLLLRDRTDPLRYLTIDRWESKEAYEEFRARCSKEFELIDERCAKLTVTETPLGNCDEVPV